MSRLGKWLALQRGERGMSVRETARKVGMSSSYLNEVENWKPCTPQTALAIADAVGGGGAVLDEAMRLWALDRAETAEREARDALTEYRAQLRLASHRTVGGTR